MTNSPIPSHAELAAAALPYFDDINSHTTLLAYCDDLSTDDPSAPLRDRLISALDADIADLLHNANTSDLYPPADDMTDPDFESLSDFMLANADYIPMIADALLERYPA